MNTAFVQFTADQLNLIEAMRRDLTHRTGWSVETEYGETDCTREHWAALYVETLPEGSWGDPGVLVSIVTRGDPMGAVGVMAADGRAIDWAETPEAVETAVAAAVVAWNAMVQ